MRILLYNPDNGVTANFMPHLWMFLLQALTPAGHEVLLIDGNTQPMSDAEIVRFVLAKGIGLVGIGAMTRMIAKAYLVADAIRAAGVPVVMGGPHVTELPEEALGRDGGLRHADAVALGEADETWPKIVADAARGALKERYVPVDAFGQERKPDLQDYPKKRREPQGAPKDGRKRRRQASRSLSGVFARRAATVISSVNPPEERPSCAPPPRTGAVHSRAARR